jgi:N,N-dimethylformamidase
MTKAEPAELPITGYLDRLSCRPGEQIEVKVSVRDGSAYRVTLERLICADPNPSGPGRRVEDLATLYSRQVQGRRQSISRGSYATIPTGPMRSGAAACTWSALIAPGRTDHDQAILSEVDGPCAVALGLGPQGVFVRLAWAEGHLVVRTGAALKPKQWYRVWAAADPATGDVAVGQTRLDNASSATGVGSAAAMTLPGGGHVLIGAEDPGAPRLHFSGKIEDPAILAGFNAGGPAGLGVLANWDFSQGIDGIAVTDVGSQGCHGTLVNRPVRGVVGARWSGTETCWRHAPADYAAIHFHADDLNDCGWQTDFSFRAPAGLRSGCYMLHLTCAAGEDWLPFYVLASRQGPRAPIAFLASTFTYIAYANHARGNADAAFKARMAAWDAYPYNADDYPLYGRSTYNLHRDGSGISLSSRLRPMLTMRPGYLTFNDAKGSGLRHFVADTHLLAWLEDKGFAYDVVTDEDLDDEGVHLLTPYRTVLTGSHPEYHTPNMLDAIEAYTHQGGRLCYLGGNGFYWRIARDRTRPHTIEIRRAEGGIRAWQAEPGEYFHQLDGALGGMWRRNRRPPQRLVGVGFSGQGLFEGTWYRRLPASYDPDYAWMFEGIDDGVIGDYGLSGGGAAGFEFDRADPDLGTPEGTVILARSENPPAHVAVVPEEMLSHITTVNGETPDALKRAEIVYFRTQSGGEVFSTGSITFLGSLWRNGFEGPVSRLLDNVVRRFARD